MVFERVDPRARELTAKYGTFARRAALAGGVLFLCLAIVWGARLTILEGFVYAWPRGFAGDFVAVMYHSQWWDGTRIMYGPVFVMQRWLVNAWPDVFTPHFFGLAHIPFVVAAFVLCLAAARASRSAIFVTLAAWLCFRALYYSFSVAANPEILELFFLSVAWFATSRSMPAIAWSAAAFATLTKVIPVTFGPLFLLRASRRAVLVGGATAVAIAAAAGFGQRMGPLELIQALLVPTHPLGEATVTQAGHIMPRSSFQFIGLNSALMRAAGLNDGDPSLGLVQNVTNVVTILVYVCVALIAVRLLLGKHAVPEVTRLALSYGMFFAMMPLTTFSTHLHTFVFLLPTWTAVIVTVMGDHLPRRKAIFAALFVPCYVLMGVPGLVTRFDRSSEGAFANLAPFAEPIWADLALIALLSVYALARMRERPVDGGANTASPGAVGRQSAARPFAS